MFRHLLTRTPTKVPPANRCGGGGSSPRNISILAEDRPSPARGRRGGVRSSARMGKRSPVDPSPGRWSLPGGSCDVRCLAILLSRGPCVVSFADPPIRRWKRKYLFANRGVFPPNRTNASRPRGGNEPRGCPLLQHHNERNADNSILSKSEVGKVVVNPPPKGSERDGMEDMDRLPSSWNVFAW